MEEPYAKSIIKVNVGGDSKVKDEIIFKSFHGKSQMILVTYDVEGNHRREQMTVNMKLDDLNRLKVAVDAQIKLFKPRK